LVTQEFDVLVKFKTRGCPTLAKGLRLQRSATAFAEAIATGNVDAGAALRAESGRLSAGRA
jgi:hypothetical protein